MVGRQDSDRHRPDDQRRRDDEVEDRLHEQGRRERRVARALHAVLDKDELDDVAAAGRRDRVDADAGHVRAEHHAQRDRPLRV